MATAHDPRLERNYSQLAWGVLLGAFLGFCLLTALSCYWVLRIRTFAVSQPEQPAELVSFVRGVDIYRRDLVQPEQPLPPSTILYEGDSVMVAESVAPGVAATVRLFDGSTIDLWPGTQLTLDEVQTTRFNKRNQRITLRVSKGLAAIHLAPPAIQLYSDVEYTLLVEVPGQPLAQAALTLGGTYRVRVLANAAPTTTASERAELAPKETQIEFVTASGALQLLYGQSEATLKAGEKIHTQGDLLSSISPTSWQFIRDSQFGQFTQEQYNNTAVQSLDSNAIQSDTWFVSGEPYGPGAIADGFFSIVSGCLERRDGIDPSSCLQPLEHVAQFRRGPPPPEHLTSFKTAITQTIDLDVTPYDQLDLTFVGRIVEQKINRAGMIGEECTLGVELRFLDSTNSHATHTLCFYARDEDGPPGTGTVSDKAYITSIKLEMGRWTPQSIDLKQLVPQMRRLESIEIYGNGHDYQSEIATVRLLGE